MLGDTSIECAQGYSAAVSDIFFVKRFPMKEEGHFWGFWDILETVRRECANASQSQDVDARPGDCQW